MVAALTIVVPCRDEEDALPSLITRLREVLPTLSTRAGRVEVMLLDDGSHDRTLAVMHDLVRPEDPIRVHHSPVGRGIGGALRLALALTDAEVVVTLDADGTYDPGDIPRLLDAIEAGADIATGSPYHPEGHVMNVPEWRITLSRSLSRLYRATTPLTLWTYTSLFRAYRRDALTRIRWTADGFLSMTEILVEAAAAGLVLAEVPTTLSRRQHGVSKLRTAHVVRDHLRYLASLTLRRQARRRLRDGVGRTPIAMS
jgi:dolichol-phosphate mannosyltransferase